MIVNLLISISWSIFGVVVIVAVASLIIGYWIDKDDE